MNDLEVSEHFKLSELVKSDIAEKRGIKNIPATFQIESLKYLVLHVLQPLRYALDRPVIVSSGYRCDELNLAVGGKWDSHHLCEGFFAAADIIVPGLTPTEVQYEIWNHSLPVEECINEYGKWVHVSARRPQLEFLKASEQGYDLVKFRGVS